MNYAETTYKPVASDKFKDYKLDKTGIIRKKTPFEESFTTFWQKVTMFMNASIIFPNNFSFGINRI